MTSGRQTLASIDQGIHEQRDKITHTEDQIQDFSSQLVILQQADAADYRALAKVRVGLLSEGELVQKLDAAERQVLAVLERREGAASELSAHIQANADHQATLAKQREQQADLVDRSAETLDEAEERTQQRLDAEPDYQAQRQRTREAEDTAHRAADKATQSEQELEQKGTSYRNDPLFMYLWQRHYGLADYQASSLTRWLDGKVARLIGFADARANYDRLREIPPRLREHADQLQRAAEQQFTALKDLDTQAQDQDAIPALEYELERQQQQLDAIDGKITDAESEQQHLLNQKAAYVAGEDEHSRSAVAFLTDEFKREDLSALRQEALLTPLPDDDLLVSRLLQRQDERRRVIGAAQGIRTTLDQHRQRLSDLEGMRMEFKRHRYDRPGSTFSDGALVAMMVGNFLNGVLDRRGLWKVLQEQQHYQRRRADPRFGSGGFRHGTVWGRGGGLGDLSDLGDLVGGLGRGTRGGGGRGRGGGKGGGFRTGGGF